MLLPIRSLHAHPHSCSSPLQPLMLFMCYSIHFSSLPAHPSPAIPSLSALYMLIHTHYAPHLSTRSCSYHATPSTSREIVHFSCFCNLGALSCNCSAPPCGDCHPSDCHVDDHSVLSCVNHHDGVPPCIDHCVGALIHCANCCAGTLCVDCHARASLKLSCCFSLYRLS